MRLLVTGSSGHLGEGLISNAAFAAERSGRSGRIERIPSESGLALAADIARECFLHELSLAAMMVF